MLVMDSESLVTYVARSALRSTVLRAIERAPRSTRALHDDLDASQSGVYKTLDELTERGLVREVEGGGEGEYEDDEWTLTARGRIVADELARQRSLEDLLDDEFWESHDVSVMPRRFRRRLAGVGKWELYRNPARNPQLLERWAVELFREADWILVGAQVYYPRFAKVVDRLAGRGVIDAETIVDERLLSESVERYAGADLSPGAGAPTGNGSSAGVATDADSQAGVDLPAGVDERVCSLDFSFAVTESVFALSLPTRDGVSDLDTVLVGSGEAAVELGRDVHDYYWERADPVEERLATV
jgi:predicted transcriptional regulator